MGIGADTASPSSFIVSRGEGQASVRNSFADAVIIRPAVMSWAGRQFRTLRDLGISPQSIIPALQAMLRERE
jgi:uncharacterized protein YbjT (DUF2867 family)